MRKIIMPAVILVSLSLMLGGCGTTADSATSGAVTEDAANTTGEEEKTQREIFAMDTYMTLTIYGANAETAADNAQNRIEELDKMLSTGDESSEVYNINKSGRGELSEDGIFLLEKSLEINKSTDGAFNPAIYPIMEIWGFPDKNYRVPEEDLITETLKLTDVSQIQYDRDTGQVDFDMEGMKIDFGGIAKGYTSSCLMDIFRDSGIESAMVSLGGNVQVLGTKPDGSKWRVAIQDPYSDDSYLGVLETKDKAVITSGGYERYFEQDGKTYHHIIDPSTGYPAQSGLKSVTIASEDGTLADGLSTSLFVMGKDKASEYWREHSDEFDAILYTDDGKIYVTEGIEKDFTSDYEFEIIRME